ncbi:hypothetical protein Fmac_002033 [Flemingia macrophylla]|uniref:Uncharacterized protein n=1 Tax=Flemingia macrophylla TaxID=520843 RepID=A0ABD1NKF9_9FABA
MYQSSEQEINIKKMGTLRGRKKIGISYRSSDASFSGSVVDSLCGSDDESLDERSSIISQDSNLASPSPSAYGSWPCMEHDTSNGFIDFCINSDVWDQKYGAVKGIGSINTQVSSDKVAGSLIDGNYPLRKDTVHGLQKSLSPMVEISHLRSPSESDCSPRSSPRVSLTSIRNRLNPFAKSKSLTSPVSCVLETEVKLTGTRNGSRNRTYQRSLLNDFSNIAKHSDIISEFINRDIQFSGLSCSPVHLHGNLKLIKRQGMLLFEFKVKCPEDVFVAKTWKSGNASNWMYTFHSTDNRKKSTATDLGSHYSSMVAQMLVSPNICSKFEGGVFDNSMMTEFVLHDLTHSITVSPEKRSYSEQHRSKTLNASRVGMKAETFMTEVETLATKNKLPSDNTDFDNSNSSPLSSTELHSNPEIAAIVLQVPFHKRESLRYKRRDKIKAEAYSKLSDLSSAVEKSGQGLHDVNVQEQMKVVLPTGNHGLPSAESQGPSSLLDRWKHGGGCDCGGWDMGCPLILLGNPSVQFAEDPLLIMGECQTLELFTQGAKDRTPTFGMTMVEEGQYAVDFHAQLSPLQAFSICVAILHGTSTFSGAGQEKKQQISRCNSLKMLLEEEVELFINSITKEENKTVSKIQNGVTLPYVLNPPFSPIARV